METDKIPTDKPSAWEPITDPYQLALLGKLGEELTECATAIFRCIIQGLDEKEPTTGKVNREWLSDELADIGAMMEHIIERLELNRSHLAARSYRKFQYKTPWFDWLRGRGKDMVARHDGAAD